MSFTNFDKTHLLSGLYVCVVEDLAEYVEVVGRDDLLDEADDGGAPHSIGQEHVRFYRRVRSGRLGGRRSGRRRIHGGGGWRHSTPCREWRDDSKILTD